MSFKLSGSVCFCREAKWIVRTAEETESVLSTPCTISTPISTACTGTIKNSTAISSVKNIRSAEGTRISVQTEWPKFNWHDLIVSNCNLYRSQIDYFIEWNYFSKEMIFKFFFLVELPVVSSQCACYTFADFWNRPNVRNIIHVFRGLWIRGAVRNHYIFTFFMHSMFDF